MTWETDLQNVSTQLCEPAGNKRIDSRLTTGTESGVNNNLKNPSSSAKSYTWIEMGHS